MIESAETVMEERASSDRLATPVLSVIAPTYNERPNIRRFVAAIDAALKGVAWEMIIVDDDSPDRTYAEVMAVAQSDPRVRCLRRIGRRGLASAVIEGVLVANAPVVVVIDSDMQHDETVLPKMFAEIQNGADLVVGTRYAGSGGIGQWDQTRARMSDFATRMAKLLIGEATSDPMSGFFMVKRSVVSACVYDLSQVGYKILLDIIASSDGRLRIAEVPYTFRERTAGESKLSLMTLAEFVFLLVEKWSGGLIPPRFILFAGVGGLGLLVHLTVLNLSGGLGIDFVVSQSLATIVAMVFNFLVNNSFTYRDRRLTGLRFYTGLITFMIACSIGALANISVADLAVQHVSSWSVAGLIGALMGAVFNFGMASNLVWNSKSRRRQKQPQLIEVEP
jgi:dolichol-phosphate mannosyltransferase